MTQHTKIVSVVDNYSIFNRVILNNKNLSDSDIIDFDNTKENVSISRRYNSFISSITDKSDFWICFVHQDFGIEENIENWLKTANKNYIYGAVGAKQFEITKEPFNISLIFGKILQGNNDFNFTSLGKDFDGEKDVDTTDCCCIIIHSSLIKKFNLKFDENLDFHMYAEDFCYRAFHDSNIKTKIKVMKCFHMGRGVYNDKFYMSAEYLKKKLNIEHVPSTCSN